MMKIKLVLFFLMMAPFCLMGQITPPYDMGKQDPYAYEKRFYQKLKEGGGKGIGQEYDLKYHRFNWYIDPDTCYISGSVTSYFVPVQSAFNHIKFELSSYLTVDSVIYGGSTINWTHTNDVLDINLGSVLPINVLDSVCIYYQGSPDAGMGFGSFIKDTHNMVPVIWTLSEPYGTKDWWPCKNILSDKIDSIDVFVTCPSAYRVASNGVLVSETTMGSDKVFHWRHRYPIAAYLIAIAVTNFAVYSDYVPLDGDTLEMLNYVFPEDLGAFQVGTAQQVAVLQLYDSLYGEYPYMKEKYGHAQFKWGGGMEHQTMSFVVNAGFDLCAHEMAHQWYGDKVTCGSWQDIWVNEGFATYSQGLTLDFLMDGYWFPFWLRDRIDDVTSEPGGSVFCYDTSDVSQVFNWRLSYQKGAMVLHMLRRILGDTVFFQGMKNIIADAQLAYSYAVTEDIQEQFELASGLNLDEYFTDWIYREGHPVYTIYGTLYPDSTAQVLIYQTPSHNSVSYFELPVPLQFKNQNRDTILIFHNTYSGQAFLVDIGFKADSIFFDPNMDLLAVLDTMLVSLGINEKENSEIRIIPNPSGDYIHILSPLPVDDLITITDITGRYCLSYPASSQRDMTLDISSLSQGTYIIQFRSGNNICNVKFVKE